MVDLKGFGQKEMEHKMKVVVSFCGQVVEGFGLVAFSFEYFTFLAAVFTKEFDDFGSSTHVGFI